MVHLLTPGDVVTLTPARRDCVVETLIGGGSQGQVYAATIGGRRVAIKWFYPEYINIDRDLWARLGRLIEEGRPHVSFLWPEALATHESMDGFGYVMPLLVDNYVSFANILGSRPIPALRTMCLAGARLAYAFHMLHGQGLCYRDISYRNVFVYPETGDVFVCDNDNVDINGSPGVVLGTPLFMAPELVRGDSGVAPSTQTDLHALAVLLFYMLHVHHPYMGKKVLDWGVFDSLAYNWLMGLEPTFIFDQEDTSNEVLPDEPETGLTALLHWRLYPAFIHELFRRAFIQGSRHPYDRVRESEWTRALAKLSDLAIECPSCRVESFHDAGRTYPLSCWGCGGDILLPLRLELGRGGPPKQIVILAPGRALYPYHLGREFGASLRIAEVVHNLVNPGTMVLVNQSEAPWTVRDTGGVLSKIPPSGVVKLEAGVKIYFGEREGLVVA
jgi:eukaryotic-like serine/threonine-protein kinase